MYKNFTILITGASRGIGEEIALKFAKEKCKIILLAKTLDFHPKLQGSLNSVAEKIRSLGSDCLPLQTDIRDELQVKNSIEKAINKFGGLNIVINNASAIELKEMETISIKKFDLIHDLNLKGTYSIIKYTLPYLLKSQGNVLTISPPLNFNPKWFKNYVAYSQSKYSMSLLTLGFSEEFRDKIKFNSLWPRTAIYTAAMELLAGKDCKELCRKPSIMADAAYLILNPKSKSSGIFYIDEQVLKDEGIDSFTKYSYCPPEKIS
ncbi:unnamed protein product [Gordionus sp. m RMFG-2023]